MVPALVSRVGNASSAHRFGREQARVINEAREHVARLVEGRPANTVFTGSATEANNLALVGMLRNSPGKREKVLVSAVEHPSVSETAKWMKEKKLAIIETIPVVSGGYVDLDALKMMVDNDTLLVSVMAANSETGVLNPIDEIADITHAKNALFHCDATQLVGRQSFDMQEMGADFVTFSAHKIYGPNGVGALVGTRRSMRELQPIIHGGKHERGLRSGSLNTAGIVGFGEAARIATEVRESESEMIAGLRNQLVNQLQAQILDTFENGDTNRRLSNTTNIQFAGADAEAVIVNMDPVAVSTGSACSAGHVEPSRVLLAMGKSREVAFESVRFSLGRFTTHEEILIAVERTAQAVDYVRSMTREIA